MTISPLIIIPALYLLVSITKPYLNKKTGLRICAICIAVSLTWITLIPFFIAGKIDSTIIGPLMGMSVTGIMYKTENTFKVAKRRNFWLIRLIIILGGTYTIWSFLNGKNDLLVLLSVMIVLALFILTFFQDQKNETKNNKIIQRLEDCC